MALVDVLAILLGATLLVVVILALLLRAASRRIQEAQEALQRMDGAKRSQSTRYGQISEQFAPWMAAWPWDPKRFKFLGDPIDGVQFTDEGIVFVEIKSAGSRLSPVQRQVRDHVEAGRVAWREFRIS